jgi:hypothetical protein
MRSATVARNNAFMVNVRSARVAVDVVAAPGRMRGSIDASVDLARRELWRAFQRGSLTEDELANRLDQLDLVANH